jgi:serine/threonine protein phosphatase PrpC
MAEPDIRNFTISKQDDFIILASDGIFDKLSDDEIAKCVTVSSTQANQTNPPQANKNLSSSLTRN